MDSRSETQRSRNLTIQQYYQQKDIDKFSVCDKLISRGVKDSSSRKYELEGIGQITSDKVNCGRYETEDVVGISVNGARRGRVKFDKNEVIRAMQMNVVFVTDNTRARERKFNLGEREIAVFLRKHGYVIAKEDELRNWWMLP
jgi:hypothetical protein